MYSTICYTNLVFKQSFEGNVDQKQNKCEEDKGFMPYEDFRYNIYIDNALI